MANQKGVKIVDEITIKKVTGGWSRWGGGRRGLIKSNGRDWTCQSCGLTHSNEDSPYMFELFPGEFVRICSKCLWLAKANQVVDFLILKELANRPKMWVDSFYDKE